VTEPGRGTRSAVLRRLRGALPVLLSAGLIAWLVWRVSPGRLAAAAAVLNWPALVLLTLAELLALLLWDTACLRWLFAQPDGRLPFAVVFRARARSYAWLVFNYELGQGVLSWELSRPRGMPLAGALSRCAVLILHDLAVLFTLGLAASFVNPDRIARGLGWVCAAGLLVLAGLALAPRLLPGRWLARLRRRAVWLGWWTWRHSLTALGLRLLFFAIIMAYLATGLWLAGLPQGARGLCGIVPLYLLVETVPSVSGLGARDAALRGLLHPSPDQEGVLLAFTLLWSTTLLLGRAAVGLVSVWLLAPAPAVPPADLPPPGE
jgi:hypothetical protein